MSWQLLFSKQSLKDAKKLKSADLWKNVDKLLNILRENPFQNSPSYEKLVGDFDGAYSRRINIRHRLIYQVEKNEKIVRILRMWTYYE
ncbi:MAG: Txe/YoeB family addiction module toxin [Acidobacteriota bacterium]|nr:Txe/YoeB family addiction module toxin [Acidobacteriota bacterium]